MRTPLLAGSLLLALIALPTLAADEPSDKDLAKKPITSSPRPAGHSLRAWWKDGSAAGHVGDWYDNRDRDHSALDLALFPQLRKVRYSKDDIDTRRDFGLQHRVLPHVVLGNSSTAAPVSLGGSNVRAYYASPRGLDLLQQHYQKHNLYIYPEHNDHDPGHNGIGDGYGDLLPTNTPYLITSQGSSGSDAYFMQAVAFTLAAFRPDVKKKLIDTGLLMPTVQMLLRWSCRSAGTLSNYYVGKAHPTAFDPADVDIDKMVERAHAIRVNTIPPFVKLAVVREEKALVGRDYCDPLTLTEQHSDTVSVISRIWRGHRRTRTLVVSAEKSVDVNNYALTFRWEVLRGDEKRIKIKPKNKAGSVVEITVDYHERRPIAPGSPLASNRVDIGVFANNGVYPSAPGFITFFSLDSEARTYDASGRTVEVGYGMGITELKILDAGKLIAELSRDALAAEVLGINAAQRAELGHVVKMLGPLAEEVKRQKREAARGSSGKGIAGAEQAYAKLLAARREALGASPLVFVGRALETSMKSAGLWNAHRETFRDRLRQADYAGQKERLAAARTKLVQLGILTDGPDEAMVFRPVLAQPGAPMARLSSYESAMVEEFNGRLLAELVLPGLVTATFHPNYVDPRLTTRKPWRDVYFYEGDTLLGWRRYLLGGPDRVYEFTAEGWLVIERDDKGRPKKARTVAYGQFVPKKPTWVNANPLVHAWGDEVITFAYEGKKRVIKARTTLKGT